MFKLLLISKYLRRKLAPLFAAACVTLCTAMVIIVISVMGGFLETLRASIQNLSPAVTISAYSATGFPRYDELCDRLEALPEVKAATPVVQTLGLMEVAGRRTDVQIAGIRPEELDQVVAFRDVIHWRTPMFVEEANQRLADPALSDDEQRFYRDQLKRYEQMKLIDDAMALRPDDALPLPEETRQLPGAITGIATLPFNRRDEHGRYVLDQNAMGGQITLTTIPLTQQGGLQDPVLRRFVIVNEFKSGHYDYDSSIVFIAFDELQSMLRMEPFESIELDPETGEETGKTTRVPGRATAVYVGAAPGVALADMRDAVDAEIARFTQEHEDVPMLGSMTWEEGSNAVLLAAVQNEKGMVTFLFVIISIVAVIMVALTFYNIVLQKTWDIGVLRAIGASRSGILGVFLGYGLAIGILGGGLGLALAALIVYNLNEIQALLNAWFGWQMWDPRIYAFDTIPEQMDAVECTFIVLGAILSSVVGALIPAIKAALLRPVEAIRYE